MKPHRIFLIFPIFTFLFAGFFHPVSAITQDLGRHFLIGKIILETKQVPLINLFSYTYPDFPFINLHWLSEVIFYIINQLIGYNGLLIFSTLTMLAAFSFVYFYRYKNADILALVIVSFLYIKILFERTDIRPEIFSFLFLSIFVVILYKNRERYTRWIFLLPLIELLWVNMHIYFIVGIAVIGLFLIDSITKEFKRGKDSPSLARSYPTSVLLVIILTFSVLATLINPSGIRGALYPFHVFENYGYTIEENQNIFFLWNYSQKETIAYFVISALFLLTTLTLTLKKTKIIDWLLSIFFIFLAASAVRNLPLFVFATFIPFANNLSILTEKFMKFRKPIILILSAIIFWQTIQAVDAKGFGFGVETGAKNASDFFLQNNLKGPIFNNFDIGGYLDYRFYPKEKVFVDNRPGEYPASFFQEVYIPMQLDKNIFEKTDQEYKFNTIFFAHTDQTPWANQFLKEIINNEKWKIIYFDDYAIILAKNNEENQNIIKKFSMQRDDLKISFLNEKDFNSLLRTASFFNKTGLTGQEIQIHQKILSIKPDFCPSIYNLSVYLLKENNPAGNIWVTKYNNQCK